jgi:hypothetical protein
MSDYARDKGGKRLSQSERIERAQARQPKRQSTEPPRPVTSDQFIANRHAEKQGRAEAAAKLAKPPSENPYLRQARELEKTAVTPDDFKQLQRFKRWAKRWERENREAIENAKRVAELKADPGYVNALEHSDSFLRTVDADYLAAASSARGYLEGSADYFGYWSKISEIESEIWAKEDAKATEMALKANSSMSEFKQQCDRTNQAAERMRAANTNKEPQQ